MLRADPLRFALRRFILDDLVQPHVAPFGPRDLPARAPIHDDILHFLAAACGERFVGDALQRQCLAAAHLFVGGDERDRADIDETLVERFRREAAEHDRMGRTDARACLHRDHAFHRHRQIDHDAVALLHAALFERVGEARDASEQVLIGDVGDGAVVGFEDDRVFVAAARFDVTVQTVVRRVQLAVLEPRTERRFRFIQHLGERLVPGKRLACEAGPEAFVIALCFRYQRLVGVHAGDCSIGRRLLRWREQARFALHVARRLSDPQVHQSQVFKRRQKVCGIRACHARRESHR
ncbi:hypothetical protein AWB80_08345 [Caballeronia pedi]|uniref:Uncharacterized protein n=1 Tax=Caballeronia pedi TaxID=1777141 RepID=A0A158E6K0_9BURK|nr:hypothetical protein AWB80_08345 [Caballeronia pedi]